VQIEAGADRSKCLDIFMGSVQPQYGADLFWCQRGDPHETFALQGVGSSFVRIVPQNGGNLCLDANGIDTYAGTQVVQNVCSASPSQTWSVRKNADGSVSILTADGTRSLFSERGPAIKNRSPVYVQSLGAGAEGRFYVSGPEWTEKPYVPQIAQDGDRTLGPAYGTDPDLLPKQGVPKGRIIQFTMPSSESRYFPGDSHVTGAFTRQVWVYVPRQYVAGAKAPFMVSQDANYRPQLSALLDNAIHDKKLPVMVIVFAGNGGGGHGIGIANDQGTERNLEYDTLSSRYGEWVQNELLPRAEAETRSQIPDQAVTFTSDPEGRGAIGCSSGAAAAFTMAWFLPNSFRRVISYSGSYTNLQYPADPNYPHGAWSYPERLIRDSPKKPIRVWLEVGTHDMDWSHWGDYLDWQAANRKMASELAQKFYRYHFDLALGAQHCDGRVPGETLGQAMQWVWADYPGPR
jgi:hypothetical protein